jgi:hypothetical protein
MKRATGRGYERAALPDQEARLVAPGVPSVVGRYARARSVCPVIAAARFCGGSMPNLLSEDLPICETGTLPPRRAALQSSAYPVLVSSYSNVAQFSL